MGQGIKNREISPFVQACVCYFNMFQWYGPHVEGSFSMMGSVIHSGTTRLDVSTFAAIQTVKYSLLAANKNAVQYFTCSDRLHDPVNARLVRNMRKASRVQEADKKKSKEAKDEKKKSLGLSLDPLPSKRKALQAAEVESKRARREHMKKTLERLSKARMRTQKK